MLNASAAVSVPITLFGGLNTELSPTDLPLGLSPDCSDVAFLPGQVFTRPPLRRYATLGTTAQIVYTHSFRKRDGTFVRMDFDATGAIYANGTKVGSTAAGSRFLCANADGRVFIAVSDGLKGTDVPLQFDGTNLDRVSQDGPAAPPTVTNYSIAPQTLVTGSAGASVNVITIQPIDPEQVQVGGGNGGTDYPGGGGYNPPQYQTVYTALQVTTGTPHGLSVGEIINIAGNSLYNVYGASVASIVSTTVFTVSYQTTADAPGTGGTVTPTAPLLVRSNGSVTATTAAPHNLQVGYHFNLDGVPDLSFAISSIVVNNDTLPGLATVTTQQTHGLQPFSSVSIANVAPVAVGGGVHNYVISGGVASVTMNSNHGLSVGMTAIVMLHTYTSRTVQVASVPNSTTFTYVTTEPNVSDTGGSVQVPWIYASDETLQIQSVPSQTSFTVPVSSPNFTWNDGNVTYPWDGTYYVATVPSSTTLTYTQLGPDATVQNGSGTLTPVGQLAPGLHRCVVMFLTRSGYLTAPSPPVTFNAAGSQYAYVSNLPVGPPNVVARYLAFSTANGARYFLLPIPAQLRGQIESTSTVVQDNSTAAAVFDFSDEALEAGIGIGPIDTPGNNLFQQVVLAPCLGFYPYESRLLAWGELNVVENLLNLGFEGGTYPNAQNVPLGWNVSGSGILGSGDYGYAWTPTGGATISQSAYKDNYGAQILEPATQYTFRCWANGTVTATITSASTGFSATATVTASKTQAQADFSAKTPAVIPSDLTISFAGAPMDELQIIYTSNPQRLGARGAYVENPEAFDDVTGTFGASDDPNPIMGMVALNGVLSFLTSGPNGNHYRVEDSSSGEPGTWTIRRHGERCGVLSPWAIATFETWFCWASDTGLRVFYGVDIEKMSQEVQSIWDSINPAARQFTVLANDPYQRRLHILLATDNATVTNTWLVMDYRELNTSQAIANSGTLKVVNSGKVITTDLTRKWAPWTPTINYCAMVQSSDGSAQMLFCGGTGTHLSDAAHSALYTLHEGDLTGLDDDYGPFWNTSYYTTAFVPDVETASQYKLQPYRLLFTYMTQNVRGIGAMINAPQAGTLGNTGRNLRPVGLSSDSPSDLAFGLEVPTERMAMRLSAQPAGVQPFAPTSPAGWAISSIVLSVLQHPYSTVRGWNKAA